MKFLQITLGTAALFLLTACTQIKYTGETMEALPSGAVVNVYMEKQQILKEYRTLGNAEYTAPSGQSSKQMWDIVKKEARERGANAVLVHSVEQIQDGMARKDQIQNAGAPGWNIQDDSSASIQKATDNIRYSSIRDPEKPVYRLKISADFLRID